MFIPNFSFYNKQGIKSSLLLHSYKSNKIVIGQYKVQVHRQHNRRLEQNQPFKQGLLYD